MPSSNIECEHRDEEISVRICSHFYARLKTEAWKQQATYYWHFGDDSLVFDIVCEECSRTTVIAKDLVTVCKDCGEHFTGHSRPTGMIGGPRFSERLDAGVFLEHKCVEWPTPLPAFTALRSLGTSANSQWLAISSDQRLWNLDVTTRTGSIIVDLSKLIQSDDEPLGLCVSGSGQLAAVVETHGSNGVVIDLASGRSTIKLQRGDYHCDVSRFPIAFVRHEDRDLLVHATDWNRLDISDPRTGRCLTERSPTSYTDGEKRPQHYLDYFHCGLLVSPDNEWIVDNGWVWHPSGVVRSWSLKPWLNGNVWESEDGATVKDLYWRTYYWDGPICWVNRRTVAIWGHGDDEQNLIPAVILFDVETGKELKAFAGPPGLSPWLHEANQRMRTVDSLLFDSFLFSFTPSDGFAVWDLSDGARLLQQSDFCPAAYCRIRKEFIGQLNDRQIRLSRVRHGPAT